MARRNASYAGVATLWRCRVLLCLGLVGCSDGAASFCQLGTEHRVALSVAHEYDAIALLERDGPDNGVLALWSEPRGLFVRLLDAMGAPTGQVQRVGARCAGGMDAIAVEGEVQIACSSPESSEKHGEPGSVALLRLGPSLELLELRHIGEIGPLSGGVALALEAGGTVMTWHDGAPDAHQVWFADLAGGAPPQVISTSGRMADAPSLGVQGGRVRVTWAERWLEHNALVSEVLQWDGSGAARAILPVAHLHARPQLIAFGEDGLLAYRDRRSKQDRTGLYLRRMGGDGELKGETSRVSRADGAGRPALVPCMGGLVTATPRTYGGDYFVGINWLDAQLERARGEQQFYEDTHAFSRAAIACVGPRALILVAEYADLHDIEGAALRAVPYSCQ